MKSSIASFVSVFALTFVGIFPTQPANSAEPIPTPLLTDVYLPILKDLKVNIDLAAKADSNKRVIFPAVANVELTVRYHRNSTSAIEVFLYAPDLIESTNCSRMSFWLRVPSKSFTEYPATSSIVNMDKIGNRKILETLSKREKMGDWFEESFRFSSPIFDNEFLEPCIATYEVFKVFIHDIAGKVKKLHYKADRKGSSFAEVYPRDSSALPEKTCPMVDVDGWGQEFPTPCVDTADITKASFSITREMIDASVAKALNPPRVVVTPPVTKTTIICVKGKLTKKVTAVKPKCPSGYKKK